jgi:hypothetical protein
MQYSLFNLEKLIDSLGSPTCFYGFLTSERISWREGAVLLSIYALFLATTFGVVHLR